MFSTLTKIMAGLTIASGVATAASIVHDKKSFDEIEDIAPIGEIGEIEEKPEIEATADEIVNSTEV